MLRSPQNKNRSPESLIQQIVKQIKVDFTEKERLLLATNSIDKNMDSRGLLSIPYEELFLQDPHYGTHPEAFQDELVIIESLFRYLRLTLDDVTTFPKNPSLGMFHIAPYGQLGSDTRFYAEQYFFALANELRKIDTTFSPYIDNAQRPEGCGSTSG